jgi:hypothetical protein
MKGTSTPLHDHQRPRKSSLSRPFITPAIDQSASNTSGSPLDVGIFSPNQYTFLCPLCTPSEPKCATIENLLASDSEHRQLACQVGAFACFIALIRPQMANHGVNRIPGVRTWLKTPIYLSTAEEGLTRAPALNLASALHLPQYCH